MSDPRLDRVDDSRRSNRLMLVKLGIVVVVMFGFGFALVPFYDQICRATGIRDIDKADEVVNTQVDLTRSVRLELDANISKLPWRFRPVTPIVNVHPGEVMQIVYEVENLSEHPVTGQAVPSYGPPLAGEYFRKLECFCFTRQVLAPHEKREMPVLFVVDPKLPKDVSAITLSYTFFEVEGNAS
jgi:cytochrome c oxidase assembly protein subunit 11